MIRRSTCSLLLALVVAAELSSSCGPLPLGGEIQSYHGTIKPRAFSALDDMGRVITLRASRHGILFSVGGEGTFHAEVTPDLSWWKNFRSGSVDLKMKLIGGRLLEKSSIKTLRLRGESIDPRGLVPLETDATETPVRIAWTTTGDLEGELDLQPLEFDREFTLVSYNVENLFDQSDDEQSAGYGDYRIEPNSSGERSNYGEPVRFEGDMHSFSEVKAEGIASVLRSIDPNGPAIVALMEIESEDALRLVHAAVRDLGYKERVFTASSKHPRVTAVGLGLLTKFPVEQVDLLQIPKVSPREEIPRPILKVRLDVWGNPFYVYANHWKSKAGPESRRKAAAEALQADLSDILEKDPDADYTILGDLNSEYNEDKVMTPRHDDTHGTTGINTVLKAQGDELAVAQGRRRIKFNLNYEVPRDRRRTHYSQGFGWSNFDHIIVGPAAYDQVGLSYVDNSYEIATVDHPTLSFAFNSDGTTRRWYSRKAGARYTEHTVGGYSDHAPIWARFHVRVDQSSEPIKLIDPAVPDEG